MHRRRKKVLQITQNLRFYFSHRPASHTRQLIDNKKHIAGSRGSAPRLSERSVGLSQQSFGR